MEVIAANVYATKHIAQHNADECGAGIRLSVNRWAWSWKHVYRAEEVNKWILNVLYIRSVFVVNFLNKIPRNVQWK